MGKDKKLRLVGQVGKSGQRDVFLGFALASQLCAASFPDILDEARGTGYQRAFSKEHSLEFKRYIHQAGATSLPLAFNLRGSRSAWELRRLSPDPCAELLIDLESGPVMAQVDGQHRLGFLHESAVTLPFMVFFGVSLTDEIEIFRTINGKAKGLSNSLLDYTEARLLDASLAAVRPELYVALGLNGNPSSPWFGKLDLGGHRTVGLHRIASLRTMQQAVKRFTRAADLNKPYDVECVLATVVAFWKAVEFVLPKQWGDPRRHLITKGVGVYALMALAGLLTKECESKAPTFNYFVSKLSDFVDQIDWSTTGPLEGYGGAKGAETALSLLLHVRTEAYKRLTSHA